VSMLTEKNQTTHLELLTTESIENQILYELACSECDNANRLCFHEANAARCKP
jgi:hypothetical protein